MEPEKWLCIDIPNSPRLSFESGPAEELLEVARDLCYSDELCSGVMLQQTSGHAPDIGSELFEDVSQKILTWRLAAKFMRSAPVPFYLVLNEQPTGELLDLALSTTGIIAFGEFDYGFPEANRGLFPVFGGAESAYQRFGIGYDMWRRDPNRALKLLHKHSFIYTLPRGPVGPQVSILAARSIKSRNIAKPLTHSSRLKLQALEQELRSDEGVGGDAVRQIVVDKTPIQTWDLCVKILKSKKDSQAYVNRGRLLAQVAARALVNTVPRSWPGLICRTPTFEKDIFMPLSGVTPPASVIRRMLESGARIVFCEEDTLTLRRSLEMLYGRLERLMGAKLTPDMWNRQVFWYVGEVDNPHVISVTFDPHDMVHLAKGDHRAVCLRLSGNQLQARLGGCELTSGLPAEDSELKILLDLVAQEVFQPSGSDNLPLTILIRSVVFQELVRLAATLQMKFRDFLTILKDHGWGFASSEDAWTRFLANRFAAVSANDDRYRAFLGGLIRPFSWTMNHQKELKGDLPGAYRGEIPYFTCESALIRHLQFLAGYLTVQLCEIGAFSDSSQAEGFVTRVVGYPAGVETPAVFWHQQPKSKTQSYLKKYWA